MLRDKSLIPLSHQHQHALALCVRIDRASPIAEVNLPAWQAEIAQLFQAEIEIHLAVEERVLFPAARAFGELVPLVEDLIADHAWLRRRFSRVISDNPCATDLLELTRRLSEHIRKEERRLFERMQQMSSREQLADLGRKLDEGLKDAAQTCILPTEATRLRSK